MPTPAAEVDVDVPLVRSLLRDQHPDLAGLPLEVVANGWDNVVLRLGDDLAVRVPRRELAARLVEHEQRWLPDIAARVGSVVPVPAPVRTGHPALGYPWSWSIVPWLPGTAIGERVAGVPVAEALAAFVGLLHVPAPDDAPANPFRAVPLASRSDAVLTRLDEHGVHRAGELATLWRTAAAVPAHAGPPVWVHGDLHPFNLLVDPSDGVDRLSAVIDFGDVTAGDPAVDLATAWLTLDRPGRHAFRAHVAASDTTWLRARGWAVALASALATADERAFRSVAQRSIDAVLDD
ncbi:aminoglycoside phosphotransferase family protein [Curtobacterium flaccumfaciens]|uniref:Aminoglycoside phosphotransferase family protein n=1 Tax=Curtobacterium poinsettiae TaxID=159612 RepID=A0A9Q9PA66_9MICO|nr:MULTISPECIES: aminoglycoside phosphotransferase family protein [Curtobacterium]MDT0232710.1 aminoglycoside phosphotransferase family protein [Curtobacterium sp. BRB10]UXN26455.1 aminoglycoside phosphotransferase family protein [Curtobacterium flaccumfaciens]UYC81296.1 aminoglycoside phosphotransferase family protein [Curtobacterium flaccumfaciens pv. poinsettiae]